MNLFLFVPLINDTNNTVVFLPSLRAYLSSTSNLFDWLLLGRYYYAVILNSNIYVGSLGLNEFI